MQLAVRIEPVEGRLVGRDDANIGQTEIGGQRVAIVERLAKVLSGIEKDDRQAGVDLRNHVQEHRRVGPEG